MIVTDHCVSRYIERVTTHSMSNAQAKAEIEAALISPIFSIDISKPPVTGKILHGCRSNAGFKFLVLEIRPGIFDCCGPAWYWHEAKKAWREYANTV